ncbi:MAG: flagellar basal body P-ring protein FlgI [Buchnera aphidicola (Pentalonia nigronervosa)]|jgi:flagellar P-ring protein precursor FlgI|uniref:Flagellar P-ring protein n=1 Tax=Buchnera aphidicola (Pentalonia nigronervosa) TaxID=1309793 RepID=A0A7H1AZW7_9GAMM|nr:MAG: flagellar basal body P-ring protein FlgI [Buchnera aphidicola (Pentalonia nigronervosa)]
MYKITLLLKSIIFIFLIFSLSVRAEKIRDLTSIQGIRDNQLIGYGLVVGLDGTGDQSIQTPFTNQALYNMLSQLGLTLPTNSNMYLKNIATVIVTATISPFSRSGEKIDVTVSSVGNAQSLRGGTLLMTPLKGVDNQIYAIAQGNILVPEKNSLQRNINFMRSTQINSGKIHSGAIIEREINNSFGKNKIINLQLNEEDFRTAQRISDMINKHYPDTATPINSKIIQITTSNNNKIQVHMLSKIQDIDISLPTQEAKVILNARTGSIVINKGVKLGSCVVSNGNTSIIVYKTNDKINNLNLATTFPKSGKKQAYLKNTINNNYINEYYNNINLHNIIRALNSLGIKTNELMSILQSMKMAGCLHAKLEIV